MLKRCVSLLLMLLFLLPATSMAADFPQSMWGLLDSFTAVFEAGDDAAIVEMGQQMIAIMEQEPDSQLRRDFVATKCVQVAESAERLGWYDVALTYYEKYIPYAQLLGQYDGIIYAQNKLILLQSRLDVFVEDTDYQPVYYGAKFEPQRGVFFGSTYDDDERILDYNTEIIQQYFPKRNSVYLMYLEFGEELETTPRYPRYFADAVKNDISLMFAWNTATSLPDIASYEAYVKRTVDYLDSLGVKVFLRFANEMNIGQNGNDAQSYVNAFRFVADYAKTKQNIAMVWSPNDLSSVDRSFEMYYPGDEYVDWVGVSMYPLRYFQGIRDHGADTDSLNTYFMSDYFADPVSRLRPIVNFMEQNGIQKPIAITECGAAHYVTTEQEDTTAWAVQRLREMYAELPRVYPQVKLMCYFNVQMLNEAHLYCLFDAPQLHQTYNEMVDSDYFLTHVSQQAPYAYRQFASGRYFRDETLRLSASAYYPKKLDGIVNYYIDGNLIAAPAEPPYECELNLGDLSAGMHTLRVELVCEGAVCLTKEFSLEISEAITVLLNGEEVLFADMRPVIVNDRTLVPVRGVFEKMGMQVEWDSSRDTAVLTKGSLRIEVPVNSQTLTVYEDGATRTVTMDTPAMLLDERTMLPLRAVSEAVYASVDWDADTNTVIIDMAL